MLAKTELFNEMSEKEMYDVIGGYGLLTSILIATALFVGSAALAGVAVVGVVALCIWMFG